MTMLMKWKVLAALGLGVFAYLSLGGVAFHYLEGASEKNHHIQIQNFTKEFLEDNRCVTDHELDALLLAILTAYDRGIIEFANTSSASNWDLASSVFFSITVVTTIGYGHIYPATVGGQAFCVVYAIIGIPLSLTLLAGIGHKLRQLFRLIDTKLDLCRKHPKVGKVFRVLLILLIGLVLFLFLPAIMFVYIDGWTYAQSLYYCFITLTTIGFGDLVPGLDETDKKRSLYRIMVGVWIFVGLSWVAGVITFLQELFMKLVSKAQDNMDRRDSKTLSLQDQDSSASGDKSAANRKDSLIVTSETPVEKPATPPPSYELHASEGDDLSSTEMKELHGQAELRPEEQSTQM